MTNGDSLIEQDALSSPPQFNRVDNFFGGLAEIDGGRGYIDKTGRTVWYTK